MEDAGQLKLIAVHRRDSVLGSGPVCTNGAFVPPIDKGKTENSL